MPARSLALLLWLWPMGVSAQFIQFNFQVDAEVTIEVMQPLDFGAMIRESEQTIGFSDLNAGIFAVSVINAAEILLEVIPTDSLTAAEEVYCLGRRCAMPVQLRFALYSGSDPRLGLEPAGLLDLPPSGRAYHVPSTGSQGQYSRFYILVGGRAEVGSAPEGAYVGDVTVLIHY